MSHDRAFLDNVTTRTIEITLGRIYDYNVPYSQFKVLRQERHEQQVRAYLNQQKMIQETEEFIERFRYKATKAVQVQSRIKQLEKLERLEVDIEDNSRLSLRFPPAPRSGDFPLIVEDLRKDFGEHMVFQNATFTIRRGEKVAFVGKNAPTIGGTRNCGVAHRKTQIIEVPFFTLFACTFSSLASFRKPLIRLNFSSIF